MTWYRESRWTEYPAGHIASPNGSVTSKDAAFRASRNDLHWTSFPAQAATASSRSARTNPCTHIAG